ncbi:MAG: M14 family metallopeptidase [Bacteroidota bacterium]
MKNAHLLYAIFILFTIGCRSYNARPYDFPKPVDTTDKPIDLQIKKMYSTNAGVYADNQFDGARLNDFQQINPDTFIATISPENEPVNPSAYYAFRLWTDLPKSVVVKIDYTSAFHRYSPKISKDGENWMLLDSTKIQMDSAMAPFIHLNLDLSPDILWVAAQELQTSRHVKDWCIQQAKNANVNFKVTGRSKQGREMLHLEIGSEDLRKKDIIGIIGRQHPPEVTGHLAMQAFIETILADTPLSNDFRKKYHVLVFPLMNPDGVDLGHWRHNAGGIDLNRDWAYYHQEEVRHVANYIAKTAKRNKAKVILGIDFHSTWRDVLYTNSQSADNLPRFKDYWVAGLRNVLSEEKIRESPSKVGTPVSKGWFLTQFNAEGIVYEVGDDTPRDLIQKKGQAAAVEMMELLIYK